MFRFFIPLILFSFSIMLYSGYTKPNMEAIAIVKEQINTASTTLSIKRDEIEAKRKELKEARESILLEDRERVRKLIPSIYEFDEAAFLNDMYQTALQHSISLKGLTVSDVNTSVEREKSLTDISTQYETVSTSFSAETTYTGIKDFLDSLEKSEQLFDVMVVSFGAASDDEEGNYQITINTYYWIP